MEELTEDSLQQRHDWVKFEEEDAKKRANIELMSRSNYSNTEAAVLPVDNHHTENVIKENGGGGNPLKVSAVIEATQVHVSIDRLNNSTGSNTVSGAVASKAPSPAPRISKDPAHAPKVPARSLKSEPNSVMSSSSKNSNDHKNAGETGIAMPLSAVTAMPPSGTNVTSHEMHTVSLSDTSNGALERTTSAVNNAHRNNASIQPFANGDILVTILPQNEQCPWVTRAIFRPELVPEELMSQHLSLTVEEYLSALEILVNDFRFNCYNICYKRILMSWILVSFFVLIVLLFSGMRGVALFGAGVMWLLINASGIFVCMWIKIRLRYHLEGCIAQVNKHFLKHKILMGVDDRGKLSCHKVNLIFIFFDCGDCVKKLQNFIENDDKTRGGQNMQLADKTDNLQARMDINDSDVIITGNTYTRIPRLQERGEKLLLRYSQRWVKEYVCKRLDLSIDPYDRQEGEPSIQPRHCVSSRCPCQFIEEHLRFKPKGQFFGCQILDI